jgi:hypothetical protein
VVLRRHWSLKDSALASHPFGGKIAAGSNMCCKHVV